MANHKARTDNCFLISIEVTNRDALFDCNRDYLVFMSLIRDGVRNYHYKVLGFCWLKEQCLMIIQPEAADVGNHILRLLKRYHFWLLQRGSAMTEFRFQMLEVRQDSWLLDSLRFIHQQAVKNTTAEDAIDYHWHSHHAYNDFWSLHWLDTDFVLNKFAGNRIAAMNRFRQYMQHPHRLDFKTLLDSLDCSKEYISEGFEGQIANGKQAVAEVNSQYHQSMIDRTEIRCVKRGARQYIQINVVDKPVADDIPAKVLHW